MNCIKTVSALLFACFLGVFAQEGADKGPDKIAVYVYGASEAGVNKSLANKLLVAALRDAKYSEIRDSEAFYEELSASKSNTAQATQSAQQRGADAVCVVNLTEAFGDYSISARLIKTSGSQVLKTASIDRSIKSLDDLAKVSNELASLLFNVPPPPPPPSAPSVPSVPAAFNPNAPYAFLAKNPSGSGLSSPSPSPLPIAAPMAAAKKECASTYSINEITYKIQNGFPSSLKDCSATLVKEIAFSKSPFSKKTAPEPKSFMTQCAVDGIKQKLPAGADEYVKPVEVFLQNIMNAASAGGSLDVAKLSSAIGGMDVNALVNEIKAKAANDACITSEPYEPSADSDGGGGGGEEGSDGEGRKILSFGIRAGLNFSHSYAEYSGYSYGGSSSGSFGFNGGFVLDIAPSGWFHIQPGLMYIQKGTADITAHYVELPILLSLKFSAFRLNSGPYMAFCVDGCSYSADFDYGISYGLGFDIGMFYIGVFYDYGLEAAYRSYNNYNGSGGSELYNRTLGFSLGVNL